MMYKRQYILIISVLIAALSLTACGRKKEDSARIIATINNCKITVDDFNFESREVLHIGKLLGEVPITKEDVLDTLILKELLLQEAQKENLDKDKNFMKTIELYWEQTLLRNLLAKKSQGAEKGITVYEDEIIGYYNKMKNKIKAKVLVLADEKSARRLLNYKGDITEYAQKDPKKIALLYTIPSRQYILGEDNSSLENNIFNIDSMKDKGLVKIDEKWALIIIEERVPNEQLEPLPTARDEISRYIKMVKERELMNEWINGLRSKARIKIDKKVLDEL